jgi:hypothetical protein
VATTNGIAIRQAVFARASAVPPAGYQAWVTARQAALPTLNSAMLPALQVLIGREQLNPRGDDNEGPVKFMAELTISISVLRGLDDPLVLDGQADQDLANILDALFEDNTFTNPFLQDPQGFKWEGVARIDQQRGTVVTDSEATFYALSVLIVFHYAITFNPPAPNWLEEVDITATVGGEGAAIGRFVVGVSEISGDQITPAIYQLGVINYSVIGPNSGAVGSPSATFILNLETGASFTGNQTIVISDGGDGGIFTPSIGAAGTGSIVVTPPETVGGPPATSFRFTYRPVVTGNITLTFANLNGWNNPAPIVYASH